MRPTTIQEHIDNKVVITITGDLTIKFSNDLKQFFNEITSYSNVLIVIDRPVGIDLSFLQLLYACKQFFEVKSMTLHIDARLNEQDSLLLTKLSFNALLNSN